MPHRFSASQWWPLVERYRPTWLNMVPTIIAYLLNGPELTPAQAAACRGVRFARSASAPLPPEQHRAFEARFGISVIEAMGLTESRVGRVRQSAGPAAGDDRQPGLPLGVEARVVAPDRTRGGRRRAGRDRAARRERDARLLQVAGAHRADALGGRLARHRRPRLSRRRRLLLHHRAPEGADHQGRREHRAARDRRGAAASIPPCSKPPPSACPTRATARRSSPASCSSRARAATRRSCVRTACAQLGRYKTPRRIPLRRGPAEGAVGQGAAPEVARPRRKAGQGTSLFEAGSPLIIGSCRESRLRSLSCHLSCHLS